MKKALILGLVVLGLVVVAVHPAAAITYGTPDGDAHPFVGIVVFYDGLGNPTHRCTGTLLAPQVLLTAGHCTAGTASAQVWFDAEITFLTGYPFTGGVTGTPVTHPLFDGFATFPNTSDVGVVLLDTPVNNGTYGALPDLGALDALATRRGLREQLFTAVGYGLQEIRPNFQADLVRYQATSRLVNLRSALTDGFNLHTSNNPGIGGGTCFGDSGGPVFLGQSNVVVAITSFGLNQNCKGADFGYRADIANTQDFVVPFLP